MAFSYKIDPATRDIVIADGQVVLDDSPATAILLAIDIPRGTWYGDPEQGSRLGELVTGHPARDPEALAAEYTREALEPLVAQGRITDLQVHAGRGSYAVAVTVSAAELPDPIDLEVS